MDYVKEAQELLDHRRQIKSGDGSSFDVRNAWSHQLNMMGNEDRLAVAKEIARQDRARLPGQDRLGVDVTTRRVGDLEILDDIILLGEVDSYDRPGEVIHWKADDRAQGKMWMSVESHDASISKWTLEEQKRESGLWLLREAELLGVGLKPEEASRWIEAEKQLEVSIFQQENKKGAVLGNAIPADRGSGSGKSR